jgi:hypothetical protein
MAGKTVTRAKLGPTALATRTIARAQFRPNRDHTTVTLLIGDLRMFSAEVWREFARNSLQPSFSFELFRTGPSKDRMSHAEDRSQRRQYQAK